MERPSFTSSLGTGGGIHLFALFRHFPGCTLCRLRSGLCILVETEKGSEFVILAPATLYQQMIKALVFAFDEQDCFAALAFKSGTTIF